ncbi:unnamed protein product [Victoria cruziana]
MVNQDNLATGSISSLQGVKQPCELQITFFRTPIYIGGRYLKAGTYIKEFVHGDLGRTHPSMNSLLGCRAEILQLDVTDVKMECFSQ